jgi:hypothetical protein
LEGDFEFPSHRVHAFQRLAKTAPPDYEPVYGHAIPILLLETSTVGIIRLLEAAVDNKRFPLVAMCGIPNNYLVQELNVS